MADNNQSTNNSNEKKGKPIKIPVISFLLKLGMTFIVSALFAGFICLLIEIILFVFDNYSLDEPLARYHSISSFSAKSGEWFNEKSSMQYLENTIADFLSEYRPQAYLQEKIVSINEFLSSHSDSVVISNSVINWVQDKMIRFIQVFPDVITLWLIVTLTWIAKLLSVMAISLPCLLIYMGGAVDGSVTRKINTFKGVPDSQDKIEWWYLGFKFVFFSYIFLYMAIPNGFTPTQVMLPSALVGAYFLRNTVANYKKYI